MAVREQGDKQYKQWRVKVIGNPSVGHFSCAFVQDVPHLDTHLSFFYVRRALLDLAYQTQSLKPGQDGAAIIPNVMRPAFVFNACARP